jgi:hypothetical protein
MKRCIAALARTTEYTTEYAEMPAACCAIVNPSDFGALLVVCTTSSRESEKSRSLSNTSSSSSSSSICSSAPGVHAKRLACSMCTFPTCTEQAGQDTLLCRGSKNTHMAETCGGTTRHACATPRGVHGMAVAPAQSDVRRTRGAAQDSGIHAAPAPTEHRHMQGCANTTATDKPTTPSPGTARGVHARPPPGGIAAASSHALHNATTTIAVLVARRRRLRQIRHICSVQISTI